MFAPVEIRDGPTSSQGGTNLQVLFLELRGEREALLPLPCLLYDSKKILLHLQGFGRVR